MGVFGVEIVLADIDNGELPERSHIHGFIEHPLAQRAVAKEANRHLIAAAHLAGERGAGGERGAAADDGIGSQVAHLLGGDVHGATLAPAIARRFAQQFGKHQINRSAFRQAVPVAAMGAGDVIIASQRLAHANRYRLFAAVQMGQTRHSGAGVEFIDLLFKEADGEHLLIDVQPLVTLPCQRSRPRLRGGRGMGMCHAFLHQAPMPNKPTLYPERRFTVAASQPSVP